MFKKTRLRILALIMAAATVIITLMLTVIYIANWNYSFQRSISLLESYAESNDNGFRPEFGAFPERPGPHPGQKDDHNTMFRLSTFYSVQYDANAEVLRVDCAGGYLYSETEILRIADSILSEGKTRGIYGQMPFLVRSDGRGTLVALLDNTMERDNSGRLFEHSLIVGILGWLAVLILSWFFTKRIVNPLEQNDIRQKQFISDAGHELKTPIAVISANAELLSMEIGENKWLSNIRYENERMGNLVRQLLELVRAENTQQTKEHLDFSRLVSGGVLPFESVAYEKGLLLTTDIRDGISVDGSRNQLNQLVSILVDNAIAHGEQGKPVTVKLDSEKRYVVLSVVNSGQPIPEDVKERLFERFYRGDASRSDEAGHYGLGLAIAKAIVTAHGGRIELNCGSGLVEFRVLLPESAVSEHYTNL